MWHKGHAINCIRNASRSSGSSGGAVRGDITAAACQICVGFVHQPPGHIIMCWPCKGHPPPAPLTRHLHHHNQQHHQVEGKFIGSIGMCSAFGLPACQFHYELLFKRIMQCGSIVVTLGCRCHTHTLTHTHKHRKRGTGIVRDS